MKRYNKIFKKNVRGVLTFVIYCIRRCLISDCFYGLLYVSHLSFLERIANPRAQVDCEHLQQQVIHMYIFAYSLTIMVNVVKLTIPK